MSAAADPSPASSLGRSIYRFLLRAYPRRFRRRFAADMLDDFDRLGGDVRHRGLAGRLRLARRLLADWLRSVVRERFGRAPDRDRELRPGRLPPLHTELRHAARRIRMSPGFSILVVLVIALGMGPATAAYSVADWILFRPIPGVSDAGELGEIGHWMVPDGGRGRSPSWISYPNLDEIAARADTLSGIAGMQGGRGTIVLESGAFETIHVEHVTAAYFPLLGLRPIAGRVFNRDEDRLTQGTDPVALISARLAGSMFGGPEAAIGQALPLNEQRLRVIGVLPPGFHGLERRGEIDVWRPGSWQPHAIAGNLDLRQDRAGGGFYRFVGRLAPGATWDQVEAELAGLNAWLAETWPEDNAGLAGTEFLVYPGIGLSALGRDVLARTVWLIAAVALSVLAIACANASGLLFLRGLAQRPEIAIQKALGAGKGRVVRQTLFESLLLSGLGAAAGLAISVALLRLFAGARVGWLRGGLDSLHMDWRAALFAVALSILVAVVAGLLATVDALRLDPARWTSGASRTIAGAGRGWQAWLGGFQIAATVPLLVGALLFGQTLWALSDVDLGFDPTGVRVLTFDVNEFSPDAPPDPGTATELIERLAARPSIAGVTIAGRVPFLKGGPSTRLHAAGNDATLVESLENPVDARFFEVMGIPRLHGRTFREDEILTHDGDSFEGVVLSAGLAARLFSTPAAAVGERLQFPERGRQGIDYRVLGVVGDVRMYDVAAPPNDIVYAPLGRMTLMTGTGILVRTRADDASLLATAIDVGRDLDPSRPVRAMSTIRSVDAMVADHLSERRLLARLFAILAAVGLLLAGVGLSASAARSVTVRTREIGVRKALGADDRTLLRTLFRGLLAVVLGGAIAGAGLAALGARLVESRLYGVATGDALTWIAAGSLLLLAVLAAGALPARTAVRIDPATALRHDG